MKLRQQAKQELMELRKRLEYLDELTSADVPHPIITRYVDTAMGFIREAVIDSDAAIGAMHMATEQLQLAEVQG